MVRTGAVVILLLCATPSLDARQTTGDQSDLSGVWVFRSATPLQRPEALKDKPFLTDAEVSTLRERARRLFTNPDSDAPVGDQLFLAALANVQQFSSANSTQSVGIDPSVVDRDFDNRTSLITDPSDGRIPVLTTDGQRRQQANAARGFNLAGARETAVEDGLPIPSGPADLSNAVRCLTWGLPRVGAAAFYTSHFQIVQAPDHVAIVQEVNHDVRLIPVDGRPALSPRIRQWNGSSRGRWEGRTLVVETGNFSPGSFFQGAAENLRLVERYSRSAPDTLEYEVTISDPTTWTRPWTVRVPLRRSDERIFEFACQEGNYYTVRGVLSAARVREQERGN